MMLDMDRMHGAGTTKVALVRLGPGALWMTTWWAGGTPSTLNTLGRSTVGPGGISGADHGREVGMSAGWRSLGWARRMTRVDVGTPDVAPKTDFVLPFAVPRCERLTSTCAQHVGNQVF